MEGGFMYYLKLFDETLLKFDMDNTITLKISNIQILSADKKRFPEALQLEVNEETIKELDKNNSIFVITPPVAALLTSKVLEKKCVLFENEGMEAMFELKVEKIPGIVAINNGLKI